MSAREIPDTPGGTRLLRSLVVLAFVAGLAWLLIGEHRVHALGWLPFGLLLLCPLMHIFMHGGHGRHAGRRAPSHEPASAGSPLQETRT